MFVKGSKNSSFSFLDPKRTRESILWIVVSYAVISALWILFSDRLVVALVSDPAAYTFFSIAKGWLFVLVTASLLFALMRRLTSRLRSAHEVLLSTSPVAITVLDCDGRVVLANRQAEELTGMASEQMEGEKASLFMRVTDLSGRTVPYEEFPAIQVLRSGKPVFHRELAVSVRGFPTRLLSVNAAPIMGGPRIEGVVSAAIDITGLKRAENELRESLDEKESLLTELNHRVNNNLQLISNLADLQSRRVSDKNAIALLKENQNRIRSIALVNEKLYLVKGFSGVSLPEYVSELVKSVFHSFGAAERGIRLTLRVDDIKLEVERAVSCGLIINEAVSNSLKYAFPGGRKGEISVALRRVEDDSMELVVADDGVGIPAGLDPLKATTLGLQMIAGLARKQLDGTFEMAKDHGTSYRIRFRNVPAETQAAGR